MREIVHRWSGQVIEPHDRAAFIGRNPGMSDNIFIVTGDSGMGMTHSAIAGIMMPELLGGREHPWSQLYDPSRKPFHSLGAFARHAGRMAGRYADWLTPGADLDDIHPGEGRVVRRGLHLIAAFRDERGIVHARGARCTHLGCVVRWNNAEKSWDCPCHGSRYDAMGRVLNGPARRDLPRQSLPQQELPRETA
jgi:Rieske Fe-S protein